MWMNGGQEKKRRSDRSQIDRNSGLKWPNLKQSGNDGSLGNVEIVLEGVLRVGMMFTPYSKHHAPCTMHHMLGVSVCRLTMVSPNTMLSDCKVQTGKIGRHCATLAVMEGTDLAYSLVGIPRLAK